MAHIFSVQYVSIYQFSDFIHEINNWISVKIFEYCHRCVVDL